MLKHQAMDATDAPPSQRRWIRWLVTGVKLSVFALLCWFIYGALQSARTQLGDHEWSVEWQWLVVSGLLYLSGVFLHSIYWHRILIATGQQVGFFDSVRAYYISQLGKYVPGKWMVVLLRRVLLRSAHVENTVVAASVFYETFSLLAVGAGISALVLVIWHPHQHLLIGLAAGSMVLLGAPTIPVLFEFLLRVLRVTRLNPTAGAKFRQITLRMLVPSWVLIAAGWLLQGMSLWATLRAVGAAAGGPFYDLSLHTSVVALSVVAGFLSQIPGGLAVREWVSAELMAPTYGESISIVSAIFYRLVLVVSELSISFILYLTMLRRRPRVAPAELTNVNNS